MLDKEPRFHGASCIRTLHQRIRPRLPSSSRDFLPTCSHKGRSTPPKTRGKRRFAAAAKVRGGALLLRRMSFAVVVFALFLISINSASAQIKPDQNIKFTNGASAVSYTHCGDADLCASITNPDGSILSIYSEGAALCQPYFLHFVLANADGKTLYEFSRAINHTLPGRLDGACGHTVSTEMVMDRGFVHMLVTENPDGTLNLQFSATGK